MTVGTLVRRSLAYHWRLHASVVAAVAVAGAVLTGALVVGDSLRGSLRAMALARVGQVSVALGGQDRFFRDALASDLATELGRPAAAVVALRGSSTRPDASARANHVQVLGVDAAFWRLAPSDDADPLAGTPTDSVVLNAALAAQLNVGVGDSVIVRVEKPSALPRDAPLASDQDLAVALSLTVRAVVGDRQFGRFALQANQVAPFTAFVSRGLLQERVGLAGRANLLLVGGGADGPTVEQADAALRRVWRLADADLSVRDLPAQGVRELRSGRVFLDAPVIRAALAADPAATGVLTYFVNALRAGPHETPYSMVAAIGPLQSPTPTSTLGAGPDALPGLVLTDWTAEDLQAKVGDPVELAYYVLGPTRELLSRTARFRITQIVPISGQYADPTLMPDFPGLADAENCRDWKPGFPVDLSKIRDKDEAYWKAHRGTPKAYVALADGQPLWQNRYGELTAIRWALLAGAASLPATASAPADDPLAVAILRQLTPADVGLTFQPLRSQALAASGQALDFGQLFIGFSFFLIVAALLLVGLLFVLNAEQRSTELGTLLAVGWTPARVRRLLVGEAFALAALGAVLGSALAATYAGLMLRGLNTTWRDAVGTSALAVHVEPGTLAIGAVIVVVIAVLAMRWTLRWLLRRPARELLATGSSGDLPASPGRAWSLPAAILAVVFAVAVLVLGARGGASAAAGAFFGGGALLLIAALLAAHAVLVRLARPSPNAALTLPWLAVRSAARRRGRSLSVVALLACAAFLIVAVGANRLDATRDAGRRDSGTGGFALLGESALPLLADLNTPAGREALGLSDADLAGVSVVPLRVRAGDDASCLNLNRAQQPRLLGVDPAALADRGAFAFAATLGDTHGASGWRLLAEGLPDGAVPAVGDQSSIIWGLGKGLGDTLDYTDERGQAFKVKIVGLLADSILQGNLVVSRDALLERYPSQCPVRMVLVDAPADRAEAVRQALSRAGADLGLELTPTVQRLAAFQAVQNTYLAVFAVLGALGLGLGSVGLGVLVLRSTLERRGELAALRAMGWRTAALQRLIRREHLGLLALGLACGVGPAIIVVLPGLRVPDAGGPILTLAVCLLGVGLSGLAWTWAATVLATRRPLLDALRDE